VLGGREGGSSQSRHVAGGADGQDASEHPMLFTRVRGMRILRSSRQGSLDGIILAVQKGGPPSSSKSGSERR
jgi:hypothetical protein